MKLIFHSIIFKSSPASSLLSSPPPKTFSSFPSPSPPSLVIYPHPLGYLAAPQAHSPDCLAAAPIPLVRQLPLCSIAPHPHLLDPFHHS